MRDAGRSARRFLAGHRQSAGAYRRDPTPWSAAQTLRHDQDEGDQEPEDLDAPQDRVPVDDGHAAHRRRGERRTVQAMAWSALFRCQRATRRRTASIMRRPWQVRYLHAACMTFL